MFTTSFHKYCYSAILISNPAERWQRVHLEMARLVTGECSRQQARLRTLDTAAGDGIPLFTGRDRKQGGLPSGDDTGRVGNQAWGAWDKLCPALCQLPGHGVMEPLQMLLPLQEHCSSTSVSNGCFLSAHFLGHTFLRGILSSLFLNFTACLLPTHHSEHCINYFSVSLLVHF